MSRQLIYKQKQEIAIIYNNEIDYTWSVDYGLIAVNIIDLQGKYKTINVLSQGDLFDIKQITENMLLHTITNCRITKCDPISLEQLYRQLIKQQKFIALTKISSNNEEKIIYFLKYLSQYGQPVNGGVMLPNITREQIANCLGIARPSVCNVIKRLGQDRKVQKQGRRLILKHEQPNTFTNNSYFYT
jgi:CRP-like cAMP-binding protein